jgi:hypothetical protein
LPAQIERLLNIDWKVLVARHGYSRPFFAKSASGLASLGRMKDERTDERVKSLKASNDLWSETHGADKVIVVLTGAVDVWAAVGVDIAEAEVDEPGAVWLPK